MCLRVIDLGWVEYVMLRYVVLACTGRITCEIFAKIIFADSLQWPVCNYLLCNKKDSSHCNYFKVVTVKSVTMVSMVTMVSVWAGVKCRCADVRTCKMQM